MLESIDSGVRWFDLFFLFDAIVNDIICYYFGIVSMMLRTLNRSLLEGGGGGLISCLIILADNFHLHPNPF